MIREAISVLLLSVVYCDVAYRYSETLDPERRFVMEWDVDYTKEIVNFKLTVALSSKEWFAFGFSDHGELTNADLLVVWTDPNETRFFKDAGTDEAAIIHIDDSQDFSLVDWCTRDGEHTVKFYRKFDTCHGDYVFDRGTANVLSFIGRGRPYTVENIDARDLASGLRYLQLLKADIRTHVPSDAFNIDFVVPSIVIPNTTDTYWRFTTTIPPMPKTVYIVGFEPINEHPGIVHHLSVTRCPVPKGKTMRYYSGRPSEYRPITDHEASQVNCSELWAAFGEGGGKFSFPNETGIPITSSNSSYYIMIGVHYHNPKHVSGLVDRSGLRLIVTPTPRLYDAEFLEMTTPSSHNLAVPPGQTDSPLTIICTAECTRTAIRPGGIWIFGYVFHNHLTARRVHVQHVRNGTQLPDVFRDDHYTPMFQEYRLLPAPVHVLPGDVLTLNVIGSTLGRKRVAVTGIYFENLVYAAELLYYPRTGLGSCEARMPERALDRFFETMHRLGGDPTSPAKGVKANYESIRWTPLKAYLYLFYTNSGLSQKCLSPAAKDLLPNQGAVARPKIQHPLKIIEPCKASPEQ